jgi:hypothetical protein
VSDCGCGAKKCGHYGADEVERLRADVARLTEELRDANARAAFYRTEAIRWNHSEICGGRCLCAEVAAEMDARAALSSSPDHHKAGNEEG